MKYAIRQYWVSVLCNSEQVRQLNLSKYVADFLDNGIRMRNSSDRAERTRLHVVIGVK